MIRSKVAFSSTFLVVFHCLEVSIWDDDTPTHHLQGGQQYRLKLSQMCPKTVQKSGPSIPVFIYIYRSF